MSDRSANRRDKGEPGGDDVRAEFLGGSVLWVGGEKRKLTLRAANLLAYLILKHGKVTGMAEALPILWGDGGAEEELRGEQSRQDRHRHAETELRKALGREGGRLAEYQRYDIVLDVRGMSADVWEFKKAVSDRAWEAAVGLYRGDFFPRGDAAWAVGVRGHLRSLYVKALEELTAGARARHDFGGVLYGLTRLANALPLSEEARGRLLEAQWAAGELDAARATWAKLGRVLAEANPALPRPEHRQIWENIQADLRDRRRNRRLGLTDPARLVRGFGAAPFAPAVGREEDAQALLGLVEARRLVTAKGPGGVGKTRLVAHAALVRAAGGHEGAWADLSECSDEEAALAALTRALGCEGHPAGLNAEALAACVGHRPLLLLLDGPEGVLGPVAQVTRVLLGRCPRLRVLAASREALGLAGEAVWETPPLAYPDPAALPARAEDLVAHVAGFGAVALFCERATEKRPGWRLMAEDAPAVAEICARLDGLPLAIELAAARVDVLTPRQIADRLGDRFPLLSGSRRDAPARQRTMRAALDWSYQALPPEGRAALQEAAVFAGGWTLEAAEAVLGSPPAPLTAVDLLGALVAKSLARADPAPGGGMRYRLLETVREYVRQAHPLPTGAAARVRRAHARHFRGKAEAEARAFGSPGEAAAMDALEAERENLLAALAWCAEGGGEAEAGAGLGLLNALWRFWRARGDAPAAYTHAQRLLARALDAGPEDPAPRAAGLFAAGYLALLLGRPPEAEAYAGEALALCAGPADERARARALWLLGNAAMARGDYDAAHARHLEALSIRERAGSPADVASSAHAVATALANQEHLAEAEPYYARCLDIDRTLGDAAAKASTLNNLVGLYTTLGDYARARENAGECLNLRVKARDRRGVAETLMQTARLAVREGHFRRAATLLGAGVALHARLGLPLPPGGEKAYEEGMAEVSLEIGADETLASETEGAGMKWREAAAYARREA